MKRTIRILCTGLALGAFIAMPATGFAQQPSSSITGLLAGIAVPDHTLGTEKGFGLGDLTNMTGAVQSNINYGGGGGAITNTNSLGNNSGITTVFQNTGNNSMFQNQTVVNVSIH